MQGFTRKAEKKVENKAGMKKHTRLQKEMLFDKESLEKIQKWTKLPLEAIKELARELGL